MSSFLVADEHISALIAAAVRYGPQATHGAPFTYRYAGRTHRLDSREAMQDLGTLLREMNAAGQVENYGEEEGTEENAPSYVLPARFVTVPTPVEALKAVKCYAYQANEAPGWDGSEAEEVCEELTGNLIVCLDGYDDAPWEWDEDTTSADPYNNQVSVSR